jgi:hypothetical protein
MGRGEPKFFSAATGRPRATTVVRAMAVLMDLLVPSLRISTIVLVRLRSRMTISKCPARSRLLNSDRRIVGKRISRKAGATRLPPSADQPRHFCGHSYSKAATFRPLKLT